MMFLHFLHIVLELKSLLFKMALGLKERVIAYMVKLINRACRQEGSERGPHL